MIIKRIEGMTRNLGAPSDWKDSDPVCNSLPIRDQNIDGLNFMISAHEFTPEELEKVKNGATLYLYIQGENHPVVGLRID